MAPLRVCGIGRFRFLSWSPQGSRVVAATRNTRFMSVQAGRRVCACACACVRVRVRACVCVCMQEKLSEGDTGRD